MNLMFAISSPGNELLSQATMIGLPERLAMIRVPVEGSVPAPTNFTIFDRVLLLLIVSGDDQVHDPAGMDTVSPLTALVRAAATSVTLQDAA
jgi:hypothetical protein